jgi:hypothetical protein
MSYLASNHIGQKEGQSQVAGFDPTTMSHVSKNALSHRGALDFNSN